MSKIVLWVSDLNYQADFYAALFGVDRPSSNPEFMEISSSSNSVLLHKLPIQYSAPTPLTAQLRAQTDVPIKPIFIVDSIQDARARTSKTFATFSSDVQRYGESLFQDCVDPEGNVIQLQQNL